MSFRDRFLALQEASKCQGEKKIDKKVTEEDSDIKCPECGAMNPVDAEKCKECGAEIEKGIDESDTSDIIKILIDLKKNQSLIKLGQYIKMIIDESDIKQQKLFDAMLEQVGWTLTDIVMFNK